MIEDEIKKLYSDYLDGLDIYENRTSLKISRIVLKPEARQGGVGTKIMQAIVNYADRNKQIVTLTPSSDFGGNKNRLIQFYKRFGFKHNKGIYKNFEFMDSMIRYPKLNENMKPIIKKLLREALMTKEESAIRIVADFTNFANEFLGINDGVQVKLAFERTPDLKTTAYYNSTGFLVVYVKDRAIIDVCRSIAHELVHHKQNLDGKLKDAVIDGEDGSPIENEANAVAGIIIRKYGRLHPEIYV